ncbi:MAG: transketolase [Actinomycetota bacterium]|nr:transketolase [Actinomycetota bacterium]
MTDLRRMATDIRQTIIEQSKRANVGHIGSCLSIADLLAALYGRVLHIPDLADPRRDRFILSKGHAALALYATLDQTGLLEEDRVEDYCSNGSRLSGHPDHLLPGVEFATGSLGQGLSLGAGCALASRLSGADYRVFVLMSDAECNEGSVWEAVMFAAHHRLSNLVVVVDDNGQQALGRTRDVLDISPLAERWQAFGWDTRSVDGHDPDGVADALDELDTTDGPPHVVVAKTVFGKGVSYMESKIHWHYWSMSDDEYALAREELSLAESLAATTETVR